MIVYEMKEETHWNEEIGQYTAFGVCAYAVTDGQYELLAEIPDAFLHPEEAEAFVERCNTLGLAVIHFSEAMYDAVCQ